jgi:PAS domain S-box-containing protein
MAVSAIGLLSLGGHYIALRAKAVGNGTLADLPGLLTALGFVFAGAAIVSLSSRGKRRSWTGEFLIVLPAWVALLAIVGYICKVPSFYRWASLEPGSAMALPSALGFVALGVAVLSARPDRSLGEILFSSTMGGTVARLLLLAPVAVPLLSALFHAGFRQTNFYNLDVAGWLFSFLNILLLTSAVWWISALLHRKDCQLRELNAGLEKRVTERTADLQASNDRLEEQILIRRRAEQSLRESEVSFRLMFFGNPLPMWVFSPETFRIIEVNDAALSGYGYSHEEFLRLAMTDIEVPDFQPGTEVRNHPAATTEGLGKHRKKDGKVIQVETISHTFEFAGKPAVLHMANDVTERRVLEEQLWQAQKMESIGQLAGGVAHDFNNLLTVIQAHCSLLALSIKPDPDEVDSVQEITQAADRAAGLTRQLLTFSRKHSMQTSRLDLNGVVTGFCKLLNRIVGEDVQLQSKLESGLPPVRADQGMLEQVLLNLVVNARDAMPNGGQLKLSTSTVRRSGTVDGLNADAPEDFVCLTVSDSGTGIPPEVLPRIFEPFFTTKEVGKGTGLGLATVYGIVKQHQGWIDVESQPGAGATFKIHLPVDQETGPLTEDSRLGVRAIGGTETVLLVEDEPPVRRLVHSALQKGGYNVIAASSGPAAQVLWQIHRDTIQVMITDVVMPGGLTGFDLARELRRERPELRVVFMSGHNIDSPHDPSTVAHGACFLRKPFDPPKLLRAIRECLDQVCEGCQPNGGA